MSEIIELTSATTHNAAKVNTTPWVMPPAECRALLIVANSKVMARPPAMPRATDTVTMVRKGLSNASKPLKAPRLGSVINTSRKVKKRGLGTQTLTHDKRSCGVTI